MNSDIYSYTVDGVKTGKICFDMHNLFCQTHWIVPEIRGTSKKKKKKDISQIKNLEFKRLASYLQKTWTFSGCACPFFFSGYAFDFCIIILLSVKSHEFFFP